MPKTVYNMYTHIFMLGPYKPRCIYAQPSVADEMTYKSVRNIEKFTWTVVKVTEYSRSLNSAGKQLAS